MKLKDKVAIVTGAGVGMGRSVALRYAKEGARVVVAEINETTGSQTSQLIKDAGGEAIFVPVDVANEDQVISLINKILDAYDHIDVLYNNVAIMLPDDTRVHELSSDTWHTLNTVNYNSAFYCTKYVITEMLKTGGGSIIMVGSPTAVVACAPQATGYSCSKAGVHSLARVIAAAYGRDNIRCNIIIPGTMDTPMNASVLSDQTNVISFEKNTFLGRLGTSNDVDGLAVFLASGESSYCTGAYFTVDGGLTAM